MIVHILVIKLLNNESEIVFIFNTYSPGISNQYCLYASKCMTGGQRVKKKKDWKSKHFCNLYSVYVIYAENGQAAILKEPIRPNFKLELVF